MCCFGPAFLLLFVALTAHIADANFTTKDSARLARREITRGDKDIKKKTKERRNPNFDIHFRTCQPSLSFSERTKKKQDHAGDVRRLAVELDAFYARCERQCAVAGG